MSLYYHVLLLQGAYYFVLFGLRVILPFVLIEDYQLDEISAVNIYTSFCFLAYFAAFITGFVGDK